MPLPPNPNAVRRNSRVGPLILPASGRSEPPPPWPLSEPPLDDELDAWAQMWATPQAVAWETLGWTRTVARYCMLLVVSERPEAKVTLLSEVRQLEDRLGLTPKAMRALLWQVAPDEVGEKRGARVATSMRDHIKAV